MTRRSKYHLDQFPQISLPEYYDPIIVVSDELLAVNVDTEKRI